MIHVYKKDGPWSKGDQNYTVKAINENHQGAYLSSGWSLSLDDALKVKKRDPKPKAQENGNNNS